MSHAGPIILKIVVGIAFVTAVGWMLFRTLRSSDEPWQLVLKWVLSAIVAVPLVMLVRYLKAAVNEGLNYGVAFFGAIAGVVLALILAVIWRNNLASILANPIGNLFDGGSDQVEPRPLYSMAQSKRKRGNYAEALVETGKQLEKFPDDFDGQLMLAEIQAENLNDLPAAQRIIEGLFDQGHPPRNIAYALNLLADWHLKYSQDPEAARRALEKIHELLPESELSALASQRIAHLADAAFLMNRHDRKPIRVGLAVPDMGLLPAEQQMKAPEADVAAQAAEYVRHLTEHPLDTDAREQLALIYAQHYGRLDLARSELEQLIACPGQPSKRV